MFAENGQRTKVSSLQSRRQDRKIYCTPRTSDISLSISHLSQTHKETMQSTLHLPCQPAPTPTRSRRRSIRQHTRRYSNSTRRRSSTLEERRLSTGASAHGPPVTDDDTLLTTDIATKLQWRQLEDCFVDLPAEHAEAVEHEWIHNFGVPILIAYKVKLRSKCETLQREQALREHATLSAFPLDATNNMESDEVDSLFIEDDTEVRRRRESAEREVRLHRELYDASWKWIEAHLDFYAAVWEERLHERGRGEVTIWGELCALRRERDALEAQVQQLRETTANDGNVDGIGKLI
jgi:hypothetical protein